MLPIAKMVRQCCVRGCSAKTSKEHVKLRRLKTDPEIRRKWLTLIDREDLIEDKKRHAICDRHFSSRQKYSANARNRSNLLADAFPDTELPSKTFGKADEVLATKESIDQPSNLTQEILFVDCGAEYNEASDEDRK